MIITLPKWAEDYYESLKDTIFTSEEEMMKVAIELSRRNVSENTGGPFGCAIFEKDLEKKLGGHKCPLIEGYWKKILVGTGVHLLKETGKKSWWALVSTN